MKPLALLFLALPLAASTINNVPTPNSVYLPGIGYAGGLEPVCARWPEVCGLVDAADFPSTPGVLADCAPYVVHGPATFFQQGCDWPSFEQDVYAPPPGRPVCLDCDPPATVVPEPSMWPLFILFGAAGLIFMWATRKPKAKP